MKWKRYKHIVQVYIGEQRGAGVRCGAKCVWDSETDNYASDMFMNVCNACVFTNITTYCYIFYTMFSCCRSHCSVWPLCLPYTFINQIYIHTYNIIVNMFILY